MLHQVLFGWYDGEPTTSATGVAAELRIGREAQAGRGSGLGNGFSLAIRGERNVRMTAKIYVALSGGKARFDASLSGGTTQSAQVLESIDGVTNAMFTVHFLQTDAFPLSINWQLTEGTEESHISLAAVTLDRTAS